jgi:two-component system response regulator FlrC
MAARKVLYVENDRAERQSLTEALGGRGFDVRAVPSAKAGLEALGTTHFDVVLCDFDTPDMNGLQMLEEVRGVQPDLPLIMMASHPSVTQAVQAVKEGATSALAPASRRAASHAGGIDSDPLHPQSPI